VLRFDPGVTRLGELADQCVGACYVARMAGVRSGSLERSLKELIPLNEAV